jgi:DsbC/DsbD-like thiol-disulfide interchange protein
LAVIAAALGALTASAQFNALEVASVLPAAPVKVAAGKTVEVPLNIRIRRGYHINSDKPAESYLIPTKLTWDLSVFNAASIKYPEPEVVKYDFSDKPLSVYSGTIEITSTLAAPTELPAGLTELSGKFRYQACNDKACLPPRTTEFSVPVAVK